MISRASLDHGGHTVRCVEEHAPSCRWVGFTTQQLHCNPAQCMHCMCRRRLNLARCAGVHVDPATCDAITAKSALPFQIVDWMFFDWEKWSLLPLIVLLCLHSLLWHIAAKADLPCLHMTAYVIAPVP